MAAARRIALELGFYQWNDAIAEKGAAGARLHFGVRAQAVWAIMADEGLIDPLVPAATPDSRYAFLCYDRWDGDADDGSRLRPGIYVLYMEVFHPEGDTERVKEAISVVTNF